MHRFAIMLMGLMLVGCASRPDRPVATGDFPAEWTVAGRLALSNGRDGGSGALNWRQGNERAHLQFVGALGRGSWDLRIVPGAVRLTLADGSVFEAPSVASLVQAHLEWDIPVASLRYWIQGRPAPGYPHAVRRDGDERLQVLEQQGWMIRFDGRLETERGERPRKITARRGEEQVRLLIREWRFESVPGELTQATQ